MSDVAVVTPVTDAYLAALRSVTDKQIGDAVKPSSPNPPPLAFYPYGVLYVGTSRLQGTLVEPHEDALHRLQLTSIGRDRAGAEWLRDRARPVLLDTTIEIGGYDVVSVELVAGQPIQRDDDVTPPLFYCVDVVNVLVTPSSGS